MMDIANTIAKPTNNQRFKSTLSETVQNFLSAGRDAAGRGANFFATIKLNLIGDRGITLYVCAAGTLSSAWSWPSASTMTMATSASAAISNSPPVKLPVASLIQPMA